MKAFRENRQLATPVTEAREGIMPPSGQKENSPMPDNPPETIPWRVASLERDLVSQKQQYEKRIEQLEGEIDRLRERFDARERNMLIWVAGTLLGLMVLLLGTLWANLGAIFPGRSG